MLRCINDKIETEGNKKRVTTQLNKECALSKPVTQMISTNPAIITFSHCIINCLQFKVISLFSQISDSVAIFKIDVVVKY